MSYDEIEIAARKAATKKAPAKKATGKKVKPKTKPKVVIRKQVTKKVSLPANDAVADRNSARSMADFAHSVGYIPEEAPVITTSGEGSAVTRYNYSHPAGPTGHVEFHADKFGATPTKIVSHFPELSVAKGRFDNYLKAFQVSSALKRQAGTLASKLYTAGPNGKPKITASARDFAKHMTKVAHLKDMSDKLDKASKTSFKGMLKSLRASHGPVEPTHDEPIANVEATSRSLVPMKGVVIPAHVGQIRRAGLVQEPESA